jgi:SHS family lactate transporter-like MFS transporter
MLSDKYEYSSSRVRTIQIVGNVGAILGSVIIGFGSQIVGRRFAITTACVVGGLLTYPYFFVPGSGLYATVFWEQFMIQGIFGIVPIYLIELSPPAFRTFVVGTAYNLGVAFASAVPVIDTKIGENFPLPSTVQDGVVTQRFDYSKGMAIFLGCAFMYTIIITFLGTEMREKDVSDDEHEPGEEELGFDVSSPVMAHGKW